MFKKFIYVISFVYLILVFCLSFFPFNFWVYIDFKLKDYMNIIPWRIFYDNYILFESWIYLQIFKQSFWNLFLLAPAWFLVNFIWKDKIKNYKNAIIFWFLISLWIEILQLFITFITKTHYKIFDIDDIILNTLWFVLGYFIYKKFIIKK